MQIRQFARIAQNYAVQVSEIVRIADNLSRAGWRWGWGSALDCEGRTIWIVDAHFPEIWIVIGAIRIVERLIQ